jgi:hypothetical protein
MDSLLVTSYSRLSHHTLTTSGLTFSIPLQEDFTLTGTMSWTATDLCLSEIGINEADQTAFIRIGGTISQLGLNIDDPLFEAGTGTYSIQSKNNSNVASGPSSIAIGVGTLASGNNSYSEGFYTVASGQYSHAEGTGTTASGIVGHAEGSGTVASADTSHAEGFKTLASGNNSHSEGYLTVASGIDSHAEGDNTVASGLRSHSEGYASIASGESSHSGGFGGSASHYAEWSRSSGLTGQYGIVSFYGSTTDATPTELFLDNSSLRFTIIPDSVYSVNVMAVAVDSNGDSIEWTGSGFLIKNIAGTTTAIGATTLVSTNSDAPMAGTTLVMTANNANNAIQFEATGTGLTVNWFVKMEYTMLGNR